MDRRHLESGDRMLCLSQIKSGHIGGVARRELGGKEYARLVRRRGRSAHLSPKINASVSRCDNSCTTAGCDGGVARRTQQRGQGIPCASNLSAFHHIHFATASTATSVDRGCLWIGVCG